MNIPDMHINLRCLFCKSALTGPEDTKLTSGDLIKCSECGEENDFDSVLEVTKEEGLEKAKAEIQKHLKGLFK